MTAGAASRACDAAILQTVPGAQPVQVVQTDAERSRRMDLVAPVLLQDFQHVPPLDFAQVARIAAGRGIDDVQGAVVRVGGGALCAW